MGFHANAMKTQFISAYNYYPKYNLSQKQQQSNRQVSTLTPNTSPKAQVSFTGSRPIDLLIRGLHLDPLMHFEKFTKEEYLRLTPAEIKSLRARSFKVIKDSLSIGVNAFDDVHSVSSVILQDMFDNFFGKGKYVVITLGRSLSTVGKALGYRIGEENVVNLPMSWSRRFKPDTTRTCDHFSIYQKINSHQEGLDKFLAYLGKLGLNRDKVLSSGKSYVLMDYCFSGDSMKGAEFLFKSFSGTPKETSSKIGKGVFSMFSVSLSSFSILSRRVRKIDKIIFLPKIATIPTRIKKFIITY